jgi:Zn-dependent protease with chaperone function
LGSWYETEDFGVEDGCLAGLLQKRLEYQADKFAAESVGRNTYAETLQNLNIATNRGLEKESLSYPTLFNRIRYVW